MTTTELETVEIIGVKFDVHFNYSSEFGFQIESVEDITGVQDLMPFLDNWVIEAVDQELGDLYRRNGWL